MLSCGRSVRQGDRGEGYHASKERCLICESAKREGEACVYILGGRQLHLKTHRNAQYLRYLLSMLMVELYNFAMVTYCVRYPSNMQYLYE